MKGNRNNLNYRRNVVKNLIEKPPFRFLKSIPSDSDSVDVDAGEHIVNIRLTGNQIELQDPRNTASLNGNQRCQTTINLYINDPHLLKKNWIAESTSKMKNDIILGKNIPNHVIMKNLLGDLGVKKYTSAPNMSGKQLTVGRMTADPSEYPSKQGGNTSDKSQPRRGGKSNETRNYGRVESRQSSGDGQGVRIEKISEDEEPVKEVNKKHLLNNSSKNINKNEVETDEKPALLDPLKRFKRRPFLVPSSSRNDGILYRDSIQSQQANVDRSSQPKRTVPSFRVRTRMVRDVLRNNPEVNNYQLELMRNHERILNALKQTDFEQHFDDLERKHRVAERCETNSKKTVAEKELPEVKPMRKVDEIIKKRTQQILNGSNRHPFCSIESHGSYEEYKRNLIHKPDVTLCKNTDLSDEESWSNSETRNIISSEFIKHKIRRFDKEAARRNMAQYGRSNDVRTKKWIDRENETRNNESRLNYGRYDEDDVYTFGSENEESITFPRETKNAMTRLMAENSKMKVTYNLNRESPVKLTEFSNDSPKLSKMKNLNQTPTRPRVGHLTEIYEEYARSNDKSNRCWPGVAERVQPLPEENMS